MHVWEEPCVSTQKNTYSEQSSRRALWVPSGLCASHMLRFSSSHGWTPRNSRFRPQVVKLFGCEPSLSQHAVTPFPTWTNTKRYVPPSHLLGWTVHLVTLWEASFTGIFLSYTKHAYEINRKWQKQESPILQRLRSQGLPENEAQTHNPDPKENKWRQSFCVTSKLRNTVGRVNHNCKEALQHLLIMQWKGTNMFILKSHK